MKPPGTIVCHNETCAIQKEGELLDWVCSVQVSNTPNWKENALLISAAPDLLAVANGIRLLGLNIHNMRLDPMRFESLLKACVEDAGLAVKKALGD